MKLTKETLKRIIKEEIVFVIKEGQYDSIAEYIKSQPPLVKSGSSLSAYQDVSTSLFDALDAVSFSGAIGYKDRELLVNWLSSHGMPKDEVKKLIARSIKSEKQKRHSPAESTDLVNVIKNEIEKQRKKGKSGYYVEFNGDQIDFYIRSLANDENYSSEDVGVAASILSKEVPNLNFIYEI